MSEKIDNETGRVKMLIDDLTRKRRKVINESCFYNIVHDCGNVTFKQKIMKPFIRFLKEEHVDKSLLKYVKSFKYRGTYNELINKLVKCSSNEWKVFSTKIFLLDKYYSKYKLDEAKTELCHYTDCYKKLKTEIQCRACLSINPLEARYCNNCGVWIVYE